MQINVLEYLEKSALKFPNKLALIDEHNEVSFSELQTKAKSIGSIILKENPSSTRKPIIVMVDRTISTVINFMGVLYSGNYYVPIDINSPSKRIEFLIKELEPLAILCAEKDAKILEKLKSIPKYFVYEEICENKIDNKALDAIKNNQIDTDPAYTIFTSGSTGVPKGIVVSHKSVIDLTEWLYGTFDFSTDEVLGNQTPFYFDASVKDIYTCMKKSITMHIIPRKLFTFPLLLIDYLNDNNITTILWATSAINIVANSKVLEKKVPLYLKKIFFAGEAMFAKQLNIWRSHLPDAMYVNLYGPSEVTVDCTYYIVNRDFSDDEAIPIGNACRNMEVMILNKEHKPVKDDEPGEICVRGTGVALGYYNDIKRSNEVFIQNPLNDSYRDIVYCTGDIARYNEYDEIVFISREDGQIKHMGNRIELGEIELAVNAIEEVDACISFYDNNLKQIVLKYIGDIEKNDVIKKIRNNIAKYMLPSVIIKKESLPYNANEKIDRRKIKENYFNGKNK